MKTKTLITVLTFLTASYCMDAQYFVGATQLINLDASQVRTILTNVGINNAFMPINGVISYKITYNTTDVFGNPTIASGALYVPQIECDMMPLVTYQHGTIFNKVQVPSNNHDMVPAVLYSGNGYIATLPDFLGLGDNPGLHPYLHWESEATACLDLIRAVREFLNDTLQKSDNGQLFLGGYSQGGHATMAIHKYISDNDLKSEFDVKGSVPMSGPYSLSTDQFDLVFGGDATFYRSEFIPYVFASYQLIYGNLYSSYNQYYDPPYAAIIQLGLAEGGPWYNSIPDNIFEFMRDSVVLNILNNPNHAVNVALRKNDLYNWIPLEPVRMVYCGMDSMVSPQCAITARDTMTALGAPDVEAIELDPDADHLGCVNPALVYALGWFNNLRDSCQYVSIPSKKKLAEISLYPNPVKNVATFSSSEIISFGIYDITGALIFRQKNNKVDMSDLSSGVYFVIGFDKQNNTMFKGKVIKN